MANYVYNSASSGEKYNAKCLNVSDDSEWTPSVAEYPEDGTIDLSGGTSGRYLDTQWVAPQDTEWTMSGIYNVVMGVSYDMYSIHYKGNQTCDIYLGSSTEDLVLSESDKDYTPPTGNWIIEEEPPSIIIGQNPNVIEGGELDDPTDIDFWFASDGGSTTAYDNATLLVNTTVTYASGARHQPTAIPVESGVEYVFEAVTTEGTIGQTVRLSCVSQGGTDIWSSTENSAPYTFTHTFTATSTSFYVYLRNVNTGYCNWEYVTLRKV